MCHEGLLQAASPCTITAFFFFAKKMQCVQAEKEFAAGVRSTELVLLTELELLPVIFASLQQGDRCTERAFCKPSSLTALKNKNDEVRSHVRSLCSSWRRECEDQ